MFRNSRSKSFRLAGGITLSLAAALLLGGCLSVNRVDQATAYSPAYVAYVSRQGSLPTEVFGNPFGQGAEADAQLISTINLASWHGSKPAHPITASERAEGHRLVMVFNPASKLIDGRKVCEKTRFETAPAAETMVVQAALCSSDTVISEARAEGPIAGGTDDEPFRTMMFNLLAVMMPAHEGSRNHECSIRTCG